jgi:Raf kinase inhibitor-like YbhB/YbcL family protein
METIKQTLKISSPSFLAGGLIPPVFSCQGKSINPAIRVQYIPEEAECLVLIMDDPDAPVKAFTHWLMWNIPPQEMIEENSNPGKTGKNSKGEKKYTGPCPPDGTHHYHFNVYALDAYLDLKEDTDKETLLKAMKGHVLSQGELIGTFSKEQNGVPNEI